MLCSTELLLAAGLAGGTRISIFFLLGVWFKSLDSTFSQALASLRLRAWNLQTHVPMQAHTHAHRSIKKISDSVQRSKSWQLLTLILTKHKQSKQTLFKAVNRQHIQNIIVKLNGNRGPPAADWQALRESQCVRSRGKQREAAGSYYSSTAELLASC